MSNEAYQPLIDDIPTLELHNLIFALNKITRIYSDESERDKYIASKRNMTPDWFNRHVGVCHLITYLTHDALTTPLRYVFGRLYDSTIDPFGEIEGGSFNESQLNFGIRVREIQGKIIPYLRGEIMKRTEP